MSKNFWQTRKGELILIALAILYVVVFVGFVIRDHNRPYAGDYTIELDRN